jgi:hypothetical protein
MLLSTTRSINIILRRIMLLLFLYVLCWGSIPCVRSTASAVRGIGTEVLVCDVVVCPRLLVTHLSRAAKRKGREKQFFRWFDGDDVDNLVADPGMKCRDQWTDEATP